MSRLYLITGFLGAGKTTFLKSFFYCFSGERVALVVNEFGQAGVDGALLAELGATLTEIDGGSIFCTCRVEQFRAALESVLRQGPAVVLVEASGLADPTDVGRILATVGGGAVYAGAVCLVDGARFQAVYATARIAKKQLAVADVVLINKRDLATAEQVEAIRQEVAALRPEAPVFETTFGKIDPQWLSALRTPVVGEGVPLLRTKDLTLRSLTLDIPPTAGRAALERFLSRLAGDTYRIKGFVALRDARLQVDCVGPLVAFSLWSGEMPHPNRLTVLFGADQPAQASLAAALAQEPELSAPGAGQAPSG